jgi:hypothetical protein
MMPMLSAWWYLLVLGLGLAGFALLALAGEREGELLLGRRPGVRERLIYRLLGWPLLAAGLLLGIVHWGGEYGPVLWLGLLAVTGVALVFAMPWRPWGKKRPAPRARQASGDVASVAAAAPVSLWQRAWRGLAVLVLLAVPLGAGWALYHQPVQPLLRADALRGQVGPWEFTLAEEEQAPPEESPSGARVKAFALRFCPTCDAHIRAAYLKFREPHPPHSLGNPFRGRHWKRLSVVQLQPGLTAQDRLWLTVVGKDGATHQIVLDVVRVSPDTARFIREQTP